MRIENLVKEEFRRGLEEGKKGLTSWSVNWKFKEEPFSGREVLRDVFVDREDAVVRLARGLGRGVMGLHEVIACVGPHGGGVSATLSVVHAALAESEKVKGVMESAVAFLETRERKDTDGETYEESHFDTFLAETDFTEVRYVIIDDADIVAENLPAFVSQIKDRAGAFRNQPAVVVGLHMWGWLSLPPQFRERISEQVVLDPLTPSDTFALLEGYLAWARGGEGLEPFDEKSLAEIVSISRGLPAAATELARHALQEAASRGVMKVTIGLVQEVAKAYGYQVLSLEREWRIGGDETRDEVLEHVVRRPQGISSSGLANATELRRTTINYHLSLMEQAGFLAKQRRGKEVLYVATEPGRMALEILLFRKLFVEVGASEISI